MKAILVSFFVFLSVLFGTVCAYNSWIENQDIIDFSQVTPLSEISKIQAITLPDGKSLVPFGALKSVNDVDEIFFSYLIDMESDKTLEVEVAKVIFEKNNTEYHDIFDLLLFDIHIETNDSSQAEVFVSVRLNMPETEAEYNLIQGSHVSFELSFVQKDSL